MLTSTAAYRASLPTPVGRATTIRVTHGPTVVAYITDDALIAGRVTAKVASRVTRSAEFTLHSDFYPNDFDDLLAPERAIVQISTGIRYSDGSQEVFPVFTGRIYQASQDADGYVDFQADDLAADVVAYRFERPASSQFGIGTSTLSEIRRLIQQAYPAATFGVNDSDDANVPPLAWDEDRGRALDDLASSLQSRWYALGNGDFVVRRFPYVLTPPVLSITDGPLGLVSRATRSKTRDGVTNSVTVVSERLDGSTPVVSTVRDNNSSSPTYVGGLFGVVSQVITVQTPLDAVLTNALAQRQLVSSLSLKEQWSWDQVPDATLEPGDTISVSYRGAVADQVIDSITYPLTTNGLMTIQGRASLPEPILTGIESVI